MEESVRPGPYEGHDCFPAEEPTGVVAMIRGERIVEISYETGPDVLMTEV